MWNDVSHLTRRFADGRCPTAQLPTTISLSGLRRMMKRLWRQSVRDIAAGVGAGVVLTQFIEALVPADKGIAAMGGLIDDLWVVTAILIRPYLRKISERFSYPNTLIAKVADESKQMHSPEQNYKPPKLKNDQPAIVKRQHHLPRRH